MRRRLDHPPQSPGAELIGRRIYPATVPFDGGPPDRAEHRVLLIEDNPADAELFGAMLESVPENPYRLTKARSLADAIDRSAINPPHIVLLDLNLSETVGLDTYNAVHQALPLTPVIVVTGSEDDSLTIGAMRAGAQDYLLKGEITAGILARTLRHSIERHRLMVEVEESRKRDAHRSTHDHLTNVLNRCLYFDRLGHALSQAIRHHERLAVIYLDLDGFRPVNDQLGHAAGDETLVQVASRIASGIRQSDTIARLGGDEFAVLFERLPDTIRIATLVDDLRGLLADPLEINGHQLMIGVSVGVAMFPDDALDPDNMLHIARNRMHRDKVKRTTMPESRRIG